jgi:hypothetical protein
MLQLIKKKIWVYCIVSFEDAIPTSRNKSAMEYFWDSHSGVCIDENLLEYYAFWSIVTNVSKDRTDFACKDKQWKKSTVWHIK